MTSFRQIAANRRNAAKSTGPTTDEGKQRSRCNAIRHGLTAETVIGALEDAEDYRAFEAAITAEYDAESAVERELVLRLASLLWRLRRATTIETGLFEIQADDLSNFKKTRQVRSDAQQIVYAMFAPPSPINEENESTPPLVTSLPINHRRSETTASPPRHPLPVIWLVVILTLRAASCGWPIFPISRSIVSADMKRRCGARQRKLCLRSIS
jgi:hypothetical protein